MLSPKEKIIAVFRNNVQGKKEETDAENPCHDGRGGHWLERQMGIAANNHNAPDILGYEMKNDTTSKTSFGDWSPDVAVFKKPKLMTREEFLFVFGKPNPEKDNRYSWSGEPVPKINQFNRFGQMLVIDELLNIHAIYSHSYDLRPDKSTRIPTELQVDDFVLATWSNFKLKKKVEDKFNQKGWFKCLKDKNGFYHEIVFYDPFDYLFFVDLVRRGVVFFDSGMHQGNARPYANWRANNAELEKYVTTRHC